MIRFVASFVWRGWTRSSVVVAMCYCEVAMGSLSPVHWLVVLVVVVLIFGPSRLAGVGRGLGESLRSFKKGLGDKDADAEAPPQVKKS
jgi:sec-independent protein translocase protein TatA